MGNSPVGVNCCPLHLHSKTAQTSRRELRAQAARGELSDFILVYHFYQHGDPDRSKIQSSHSQKISHVHSSCCNASWPVCLPSNLFYHSALVALTRCTLSPPFHCPSDLSSFLSSPPSTFPSLSHFASPSPSLSSPFPFSFHLPFPFPPFPFLKYQGLGSAVIASRVRGGTPTAKCICMIWSPRKLSGGK